MPLASLLLAMSFLSNSAYGVIAVDNTTSSNATSTSLTFSHTVGSGSDRLLLVAVVTGASTTTGSDATTVSSVTYGGTGLTQVGTVVEEGNRVRAYIFSMLNPPSGTANVVVTQGASRPLSAGATSFTGANQTTPLGTFYSNTVGTPPGFPGGATSASLTGISSGEGQLVFDVLGLDSDGSNYTLTPGTGQTSLWTRTSSTLVAAGGSRKNGAASVDLAWTWSAADQQQYVLGAVPILKSPTLDPSIHFDAASSKDGTSVSSLTWSHTVASDSNRVLIVGVQSEDTVVRYPSSVTYNGTPLTQINSVSAGTSFYQNVCLWYLLAPAATTANVVVTWSASVNAATAGAISLFNVAQAAPEANATNYNDTGLTTTNITTKAPNAWVVDMFGSGDSQGDLAPGSGQTQRFIDDATGGTTSGGGSTKLVATPGATSMTWTQTGTNRSAQVVASFAPAVYYSKGSLAVNAASNWNTTRDGTGTNASSFTAGTTWIIQNAHSMTLSGSSAWDVSSTGAVQIENGGTWTNSSSGTVTTEIFQVDNGGTYSHGTSNSLPGTMKTFQATSTVNYSLAGAQTVEALTYGHLTISGSGTKTLGGNATIAGDLTVSAGTLDLSSYTADRASAGGTITISNGATLKIGGTNGFPSNYSTTTLGATSTVEYSGSAQSVAAKSYGHLTLSGSGTKTIAASTTAAGDLTTSGTLTASCSGSLTVTGSVSIGSGTSFDGGSGTIDVNGSLTAAGTAFTATSGSLYVAGDFSITAGSFTHNSGTLVLDGNTTTITCSGATLNNLTINKVVEDDLYLNTGSSLTVSGALDIQSGYLILDPDNSLWAGSVSVAIGGFLRNFGTGSITLGGDLYNNGHVDLAGGSDGACAAANRIQIRSSEEGTQRLWTAGASGEFFMIDLDVKDQAGTAPITCYGSLDSGNNGANWTINTSCTGAPTAVSLISFTASESESGTRLQWQTGYEVENLGFKLYRESASGLRPITPGLVAGSALFAGARTALTAGRSYVWWDRDKDARIGARYWLQDIDLNGATTMHGPVVPMPAPLDALPSDPSPLLEQIGRASPASVPYELSAGFLPVGGSLSPPFPAADPAEEPGAAQFDITARPAVKLLVQQTGWYRVTGAQLLAAGIESDVDARNLRLFTEGVEHAILVSGEADGRLDPDDAVAFYGQGIDTPWSDTRTYWLTAGQLPGKRITQAVIGGAPAPDTGFSYSIEHKPRTIYFAALLNGDAGNFFGPVVGSSATEDVFRLHHLDLSSGTGAELQVVLQGVSMTPHHVRISFNAVDLGTLSFEDHAQGTLTVPVPQQLLREGDNQLSLVSLGGDTDVSLIDSITLSYPHTFTADNDEQLLALGAGSSVTLGGFSTPSIHLLDVTEPAAIRELAVQPVAAGASFSISAGVPPGNPQARLYAFAENRILPPAAVLADTPSRWNSETAGADVILISHSAFMDAARSLKTQHQAAGLQAALVDIQDIYDEYSFGHKSPRAVKDFLARALSSWRKMPRWMVLIGDASLDPRNYLGLGVEDFVPTRMLDTQYLETASDDWFADVNNDSSLELALGRLPARTPAEANTLVAKLAAYRSLPHDADWLQRILLVADENDSWDFEAASETVQNDLGPNLSFQTVYRGRSGTAAARSSLLAGFNNGAAVVNYFGHGSVAIWRENLLTLADAAALSNGSALPLLLAMTCLNGFFADVYSESLAEALLKAPNGGALAVWASSGLTEPQSQFLLNREFYRLLRQPGITIGQAAARAKRATDDLDVRRTWLLLGDPTLPSPLAPLAPPADTTPPTISSVSSSSITETSAVITWSTDEDSDSQVEYGLSTACGSFSALDPTPVKLHSRTLTGLSPATLYHYRVLSRNKAGNAAVQGGYTFTTAQPADETPPAISGVLLTRLTATSATITWQTDEPADAQLEFGPTQAYGRLSTLNTALATAHSELMTGLTPSTPYYFRVKSRDAAGNLAVSSPYTFTTPPAADTTPPVISGIACSALTATSVLVSWVTSEPADAQVEFGPSPYYGNSSALDPSLSVQHSQLLSGLTPNSTFHFRLRSCDAAGNLAVSPGLTFTTLPAVGAPPPGAMQLLLPRMAPPAANAIAAAQSAESWHTGVSVVNFDNVPADLSFTLFDHNGAPLQAPGISNPAFRNLNPGAQLSAVDSQLFGSAFEQQQIGWIRIDSSVSRIFSFYSVFNSTLTALDTINLSENRTTASILPEIDAAGYTLINISNPSSTAAALRIDLIKQDGSPRASAIRWLQAFGAAQLDLRSDLFPFSAPEHTDYLRVVSSEAVSTSEIFSDSSDTAALEARDVRAAEETLYSPQYVVGGPYHSTLSIVNLDALPGTVTLRFLGDDATPIGDSRTLTVGPHGKLTIDAADFFGEPVEGEIRQGYLEIRGSGIHLAGSVAFRDAARSRFSCALPLVSQLKASMMFGHVASDADFFTGLTILNPGEENAFVRIDLYTADGRKEASVAEWLPRKHRTARLLTQIFPALADQSRRSGYFWVTADRPIAAFALIGTQDLTSLAAVPPQDVSK